MKNNRNNKSYNDNGGSSNGFGTHHSGNSASGSFSSYSGGPPNFHENVETTKMFNDRLDYILINFLGHQVVVSVASGFKYEGLLAACDPTFATSENLSDVNNCGLNVVLQSPKIVSSGINGDSFIEKKLNEILIIKCADVVDLEIKDVNLILDQKYLESIKKLEEEKEETEKIQKAAEAKLEEEQAAKVLKKEEEQKVNLAREEALKEEEKKAAKEKEALDRIEQNEKVVNEKALKEKEIVEAQQEKTATVGDQSTIDKKEIEKVDPGKSADQAVTKNETIGSQLSAPAKFKKFYEKKEKSPAFKTDSDISGIKSPAKERELHKWVPESGHSNTNSALESFDDKSHSTGKWDQFAANKKKFNVTATYDEHLYTTRINYSDPNFQKNYDAAGKLAKEIENQGPAGNMHLAEDRGLDWDDDTIDEEDKYSGVDRRGDEILAAIQKKKTVPVEETKVPTVHHKTTSVLKNHLPATPMIRSSSKNKNKKYISEIRMDASRQDQIQNLKDFSQSFQIPSKISSLSQSSNEKAKPKTQTASTKPESIVEAPKSPEKSAVPVDVSVGKNSVTEDPVSNTNSATINPQSPSTKTVKTRGFFETALKPRAPESGKAVHKDINFNMFLVAETKYIKEKEEKSNLNEEFAMRPFLIEKPYFTLPLWESTVQETFKDLLENEFKMSPRLSRKAAMVGSPIVQNVPGNGMISPGFIVGGTPPMFANAGMSPQGVMAGMPVGMPSNYNNGYAPYRPPQAGPNGVPGGYVQVQPMFYPPNMMGGVPMGQPMNQGVNYAPYYNPAVSAGSNISYQHNSSHRSKNGKQNHHHNNNSNNNNSYKMNNPVGPSGYISQGNVMAPYFPYQVGQYQPPYQQPMMPANSNVGGGYSGSNTDGHRYNPNYANSKPYNNKK